FYLFERGNGVVARAGAGWRPVEESPGDGRERWMGRSGAVLVSSYGPFAGTMSASCRAGYRDASVEISVSGQPSLRLPASDTSFVPLARPMSIDQAVSGGTIAISLAMQGDPDPVRALLCRSFEFRRNGALPAR